MIELKMDSEQNIEVSLNSLPIAFHPTFYAVYEKVAKWLSRFCYSIDKSISNDLALFYLLGSKKFLDHRDPSHLFRLVLAVHLMQKKLIFETTLASQTRHVEIKWLSGDLIFPFAGNRAVMGCLIGFNLMDRHEVFDEDNVVLALKKHLPEVRLVKESSYRHTSPHKHLELFYFEIEKKDSTHFSLQERVLLKAHLQEKVKKSIQSLSPTIFMGNNDEDVYKSALILGQEIHCLNDLPQVSITLDQQTGKDVIFRITIVHVAPFHTFSLGRCFFDTPFVSEKMLIVGHLNQHPIEAHIFRLHLPRDTLFLRSDGSLDFYAARQKVVASVASAIGEFRDYNGGILIKQQELLRDLKKEFSAVSTADHELIDVFFYAMTPLEKQVTLQKETLYTLFRYFQKERQQPLTQDAYACKVYEQDSLIYLIVHGSDSSMITAITTAIQRLSYMGQDITYNTMEIAEGAFFNAILLQENSKKPMFIEAIQDACQTWYQRRKAHQVLRIALDAPIVSLDPRIGGDTTSTEILKLLFEGLTRYDQHGKVENGIAEHISISSDLKEYNFRLRPALWSDGSPISAYDFEYAWKKILSPDFKTTCAHLFYPIRNAKEAKEGRVPIGEIGIEVVDPHTLKVVLERPTPYFLQMTASTIYSPVHRLVDQQHPHWAYESEKKYPCNGPFQLKMNQPNQGLQLIKNPFYWDLNQITLDQVTMSVMAPAQAIQAFQKSDVDWIGGPFGDWRPFYEPEKEQSKESSTLFFPDCSTCWCVFNTRSSPFHHLKLRQAFAYAIQRSHIVGTAGMPLNPAYSILLPHYRQHALPLFPDYNPEKSRQLFRESLDELALSEKTLPPLCIVYHEQWLHEQPATCLKQQFQEIFNIECVLKPLSWKAMLNRITNKDFQLSLINWTAWIDDPIYTLNVFKLADQELNFAKWENTEYRQLLDLSDQQINPFQRSSAQLKAEEILSREMPVIPLFHQPNKAVVKKNLHIVSGKPNGPLNISRSFFKRL